MNRRALLRSAGLATALLAGCVGSDDPGANAPTETPGRSPGPTDTPGDGTPSDTPDVSAGVVGTSFDVVENTCGNGRDEATVSFGTDAVTVTGTISGRNACYTAQLRGATLEGGQLTVAVRSFVPESGRTRSCAECLVDIDYDARVELDGGLPEEVVVIHNREEVARRER